MIFLETLLAGCYVIEPKCIPDERGLFARLYDEGEFRAHNLKTGMVQSSLSYNSSVLTLRGLHFQAPPHDEAKLVRCTRGTVFDVAVDLRRSSPTHLAWHGVELSEENRLAIYIPEGMAHGFLTLTDDAEVLYNISASFVPSAARGIRWNDPTVDIAWPADPRLISVRDSSLPFVRDGQDWASPTAG